MDSFEGEVKSSKQSDIHNKQHDNGAANNNSSSNNNGNSSNNNDNSNSINNDRDKDNDISLDLGNDNDKSSHGDNGIGSEGDVQPQVSLDCHDNWKAAAADEKKHMWSIFEEMGIFVSACRHSLILWITDMVRSSEK